MNSSDACRHKVSYSEYCHDCAAEGLASVGSTHQHSRIFLHSTTSAPRIESIPKASKNDQSKVDLSLIPYIAQIAEAKAFQVGEKKYGRYNYCKGHNASQLIAAAQRHLLAWFQGEENDPIDGQPHLGSVRACMAMLLRQQELGTLIDDRFKQEIK